MNLAFLSYGRNGSVAIQNGTPPPQTGVDVDPEAMTWALNGAQYLIGQDRPIPQSHLSGVIGVFDLDDANQVDRIEKARVQSISNYMHALTEDDD